MNVPLDRRFEVFIGSPFHGLKAVREALRDAILHAGHFPCGTELWAASPDPTLDVILGYLDRCDIHMLVLGANYGSMVPKEQSPDAAKKGLSFTEWEYEESIKSRRPVIAFLQDSKEVKLARKKQNSKEPRGAYDRFRNRVEAARVVVYFSGRAVGTMKLERDCVLALHTFRFGRPARELADRGWIRASSEEGKNLSAIRESPILQEVIERISKFDVLARRMNEQPIAKRTMARHFWAHMQRRVRDWCQAKSRDQDSNLDKRPMQIFFESGSTIVYLAKRFEEYILGGAGIHENWRIRTNNILCLLQFDLFTTNDARSFPDGKPDPEDKYGAIFPASWGVLERPPHRGPTPASTSEEAAIQTASTSLNEGGTPCTFIFAAASGWDVDHKYLEFRGPHVGSYKNKLFKRILLESDNPVVIFIDAVKFGSPRGDGCYTVFGRSSPLATWLKNKPIALCIGWEGATASLDPKSMNALRFSETNRDRKPDPDQILGHLVWIRKEIMKQQLGFDTEYFCQDECQPGGLWAGAFLLGNTRFCKEVPVISGISLPCLDEARDLGVGPLRAAKEKEQKKRRERTKGTLESAGRPVSSSGRKRRTRKI